MFESFKSFVSDFVDGEKHPSQFADNDYRLAAVALLVHAAALCRFNEGRRLDRRFSCDVANQLFVHELLDTHVAEFAPVTGILDAAER